MRENAGEFGRCDGEFSVDSKLVLCVEDNEIRCRVFPIARYTKRYTEDDVDCVALIDDLRRTTCLAWVDGCIAGQIIRRENWNRFALVDDIAVVVISGE